MRLKEVRIKRFGCLEDFTAEFKPGLNIIRGPNESGKSTLHQALLMILAAQPNQNKTAGLWRNWSSEQWYRLELDFEDRQSEPYQITKDFESRFQELKIPGGASAKNRGSISAALEKVLGTSSMLVLRSTLCVEQDALSAIADGRGEIAQSLEAVVTGGEEGSYTETAIKRLDRKISGHQKGMKRLAMKPGPLAWARNQRDRLTEQVSKYREQVQEQATNEDTLDKVSSKLAEIDEVLVPKKTTWQQVTRRQELQSEFAQSSQIEKALEAKVEQVQEAQEKIEEAVREIGTLGSVALLSDSQVRKASELASRIQTLEEGYAKYQKAMIAYEQEMAIRKEKIAAYREKHAAYETALKLFEQKEADYRKALEVYQVAVEGHGHKVTAYQAAWEPYEAARSAKKQETAQYEAQRETYERARKDYEAELEIYNAARAEQEKQLDAYDQAQSTYEEQLAAYEEEQKRIHELREAYGQAQVAYEEELAAYEKAVVDLSTKEKESKANSTDSGRGWRALTGLGGVTAVAGLLLWLLANNITAGLALLGIGTLLLLAGFWSRSRVMGAKAAQMARDKEIVALQKPQAPTHEKSEPINKERPQVPQRPKLSALTQPQPPVPPQPPPSLSEQLQKPDIERPLPLTLEQPKPPLGQRPEPPSRLPPPPRKPIFDEEGLNADRAELQKILQGADCATVDALNKQYAQVAALRSREERARSRLVGLLGDSTAEDLKQQRREASRRRRDAQEMLKEPELQRVATMRPESVNHLDREIKTLEQEQTELQEKQQRLQIRLEQQLVSHEDLLHAKEQLAAAEQAYKREQERGVVYALTREMLAEARTSTLKHAQARLGPQTAEYLDTLTHGRYQKVSIDSDLNIKLRDPAGSERRILPDRLSRGTQDQLYMAARLALVDLLFPNTRPPILLDDPFVHFDLQRLAAAIEMCEELAAERQILLFTFSDNYNEVGHHIVMPLLGQLEG